MNIKLKNRYAGFNLIGWIIAIPLVLIGLVILVFIGCELNKAYWDYKVDKMCEKDGGMHIIERVSVTNEDIDLLGHVNGKISVPIKELEPANAPVYSEDTTTYIRDTYPKVWRTDVKILRRADRKVIAKYVSYSRVGGDFPTGLAHDSSFGCPDSKIIISEIERLFIVQGDSK